MKQSHYIRAAKNLPPELANAVANILDDQQRVVKKDLLRRERASGFGSPGVARSLVRLNARYLPPRHRFYRASSNGRNRNHRRPRTVDAEPPFQSIPKFRNCRTERWVTHQELAAILEYEL